MEAVLGHGDRDRMVAVEVARLLPRRIPHARLTEYHGEGHTVDYRHIDEILATLAATVRSQPA